MSDTITTISDLREHMTGEADILNVFVVASAQAFHGDQEVPLINEADRVQVEGFVLHPRKLQCFPVEVSAETAEEADYVLRIVRDSLPALVARAGSICYTAEMQRFGVHDQLGARLPGGAQ